MNGTCSRRRQFVLSRQTARLRSSAIAAQFFLLLSFLLVLSGCIDVTYEDPPPGAFLGRGGVYDYSPTAIQIGETQQFWWCGQGHNPTQPSQDTDTIQYVSLNLTTHAKSMPKTVLAETPGSWDSAYLCNPKVIGGVFANPLGDGKTYSYAMYYVATANASGSNNNIGVAFSTDGINWSKYPEPVIRASTQVYYGVAQPAVYNSDQKSGIWLFYEDANDPSFANRHLLATSTDGVHFVNKGVVTSNGLSQYVPDASWGDMAYDPVAHYWYALFHLPGSTGRPAATTGDVSERGQVGVVLFRITNEALLTGSTPWEYLKSFDTNLTGNELNFLGGFVRDQFGNLNLPNYPSIQVLTTISNPKPAWNSNPAESGNSAYPSTWDISLLSWAPGATAMALNRYKNSAGHEVTTGWVDPAGKYQVEMVLGHLYEAPEQGANLALYGCKQGSVGYFVSADRDCGGALFRGIVGYGFETAPPGTQVLPLYACTAAGDQFVSNQGDCEGKGSGKLLGYGLP